MKLVDIFNVLVMKGLKENRPDMDWGVHGMQMRADGRLIQKPADEKDLPEGFDLAALRAMEAAQSNAPLPNPESFRTAISYKEAQKVFDSLAGLRSIDFRYLKQGCEARCHIMCGELFDQKIIAQKAWAFEGQNRLKVVFSDQSSADWPRFHVAPIVQVVMPDGKTQNYVIDPGLFKGPATVEQWRDTMRAKQENVYITNYDKGPNGMADAYQPERHLEADHDRVARLNVARGNNEAKRLNLPERPLFEGNFAKNVAEQIKNLRKKPAMNF